MSSAASEVFIKDKISIQNFKKFVNERRGIFAHFLINANKFEGKKCGILKVCSNWIIAMSVWT